MKIWQAKEAGLARVIGLAVALLCPTMEVEAADKSAACTPVESAVFANRVHVRCEYPVDGKFLYFAAATSDSKFANRALSVILVAQESGKVVTILFDPLDTSGSNFGCNANDCRRISAILLDDNTLPPGPPQPPPPPPPPPPTAANVQCMAACASKFQVCEDAAPTPIAERKCKTLRNTCEKKCPP